MKPGRTQKLDLEARSSTRFHAMNWNIDRHQRGRQTERITECVGKLKTLPIPVHGQFTHFVSRYLCSA